MHLIIGGAYQGKLEYATETYNLQENEIFTCTRETGIEPGFRAYNHFEEYLWYCMKNDLTPDYSFPESAVVLMNEIFSGVVPINQDIRFWREYCGRAGAELAKRASTVTRLFCGLPQQLK